MPRSLVRVSSDELLLSLRLKVWIRSRDSLSDFSQLTLELFLDFPIELIEELCLLKRIEGYVLVDFKSPLFVPVTIDMIGV
jgi:hypothetical protein